MNNGIIGAYNTITFADYFEPTDTEKASGIESVDKFINAYKSNGLPLTISITNATTLFYLLYAEYANSSIANMDENQFKFRLFSIIFRYGPAWEKRLEIQTNIKNLSLEDIQTGSKTIYNHGMNPGTVPSTEELDAINDQSVQKTKRGKLDAYAYLWDMIQTDVTTEFINKFKALFIKVVADQRPLLYEEEE